LVEVRDSVGLVSNQVIQTVGRACVDEAIPDPLSCPDGLADIRDNLERRLDTIFVGLAGVQTVNVVFSRESKDVESVLTGKGNQLA
jgi:hypothetical protein